MGEQIFPEPTAGSIIYNDKGEILLIRSHKWGEMWHIPGGHVELSETSEQALKREIQEETGLEIDQVEFIGWQDAINPEFFYKERHFIFLDFCARAAGGELRASDEMEEWVWVNTEKALKELTIDPYTIKTIEFYLAHLAKKAGADYEAKWKRVLADYDNLKKETAKEREEMGKFALGMAAMNFLEVYENLKKAMANSTLPSSWQGDAAQPLRPEGGIKEGWEQWENWKKGIEHIKKQFAEILKQTGIEEIKTVGEKFDPKLHEAVGEESVEGQGVGLIVREVEGGYKMGEKVIRAARVIVSR